VLEEHAVEHGEDDVLLSLGEAAHALELTLELGGGGQRPAYPDGYVKYTNANHQGVDPNSGQTLPRADAHHTLTPAPTPPQ